MSAFERSPIADDSALRFSSLAKMEEAERTLLQEAAIPGKFELPAFQEQIRQFIVRGRATGAILDAGDERRRAQHLLNFWDRKLTEHDCEDIPDSTLKEFDPAVETDLPPESFPYGGLTPFEQQDSRRFFGRRQFVAHLLQQLADQRLLVIAGSPGSGKTSLVQAGILPALAQHTSAGRQVWRSYSLITPGSHPLKNLARRIEHPLGQETASGALLLIVDRFEEIFTLCHDAKVRKAFIDKLIELAISPTRSCAVLLVLRSGNDIEQRAAQAHKSLDPQQWIHLAPLNAAELRETIEWPAKLVGLKPEPDLVDLLIRDFREEPAGLILLQLVLLKLWQRRDRNRITLQQYRELGRGKAVLIQDADAFFQRLAPEDRITAKQILLRLVRIGEGQTVTVARIRRSALDLQGKGNQIEAMLNELIKANIVREIVGTAPEDAQVELIHPALLQDWPTLQNWLAEERETMRRRQRLTSAAEQWDMSGHDNSELLHGRQINQALLFTNLNSLERLFLRASLLAKARADEQDIADAAALDQARREALEAAQQRADEQASAAQRLRRYVVALGVALLLLLVAISYAMLLTQAVVTAQQVEISARELLDINNSTATMNVVSMQAVQTQLALAETSAAAGSESARSTITVSEATIQAGRTAEANNRTTSVALQGTVQGAQATIQAAQGSSDLYLGQLQGAQTEVVDTRLFAAQAEAARRDAEANLVIARSTAVAAEAAQKAAEETAQGADDARKTAVTDRDVAQKARDEAQATAAVAMATATAAAIERQAALDQLNQVQLMGTSLSEQLTIARATITAYELQRPTGRVISPDPQTSPGQSLGTPTPTTEP